ncbi:hypothetical protein [Luteimonas cucumeris]|uniref:hypothetical protein n=1 Tax=Luteimonas cucumeris TaxID=985012 RepID=UPI00131573A7|nr:hypothetical protein [Luteimonas cucumeris]
MGTLKKAIASLLVAVGAMPSPGSGTTPVVIHVGGDGSHLAIADLARYVSFVGDWAENDRLRKHLMAQTEKESIIAWGSGFETDWVVSVKPGISQRQGYREFQSVISTQSGKLHLVNYDSLTMAAQFDDYRLPDKETESYAFRIPPGRYRVRIVQLVNPDSNWWESLGDGDPAFLVEYEPADSSDRSQQMVPWVLF